jgi:OPT family oligopeptide transporter
MAINQLTEEQIKEWSLEQKDTWWLNNVWKGNMPQLTIRSAIFGMMIGGILSLTNLYVGMKTGWTLGVGITSVILAFAFFKIMSTLIGKIIGGFIFFAILAYVVFIQIPNTRGWTLGSIILLLLISAAVIYLLASAKGYTVLENNCMQSIATAAGYTTSPMISSLAAYMMITGKILPIQLIYVWIFLVGVLGVLFAFPLKKRFINEEQNPFPEGRAAGVVMDALHSGSSKEGVFKAAVLAVTGAGAAILKLMQSETIMAKMKLSFFIPEYLDGWIYKFWTLKIGGIELRELTVRPDTDFVMMAAGGLMGIRTGVSLMVGAVINYCILAPWMIHRGDLAGKVANGVTHYGFRNITMWALWGGVAIMTTASLCAFFSKPKMIVDSFANMLRKKKSASVDVLKDIELPISLSILGVPIVGALLVYVSHVYFGINILMGIIAIPLVFVFTLIAAHSTALTSITPTGALGKLTQLTFGALSPGNITTNVMTAAITGEVASNASNLLMDIKPGYMLGGKPRQQAIGHVLGIIAGSLVAVPVFYFLFLKGNPAGLVSDQYPMPAASIWKAVAEVLTKGLSNLTESARWAALIGAILGIGMEIAKIKTKGKFWISGVGIGLAFVIPFNTCLAMFLGSFIFWLCGRYMKDTERLGHKIMVQNLEPVCAGVIAGGAITGILVTLLETFVFA